MVPTTIQTQMEAPITTTAKVVLLTQHQALVESQRND